MERISPYEFGRLVDYLGDPSLVRIRYIAPDYEHELSRLMPIAGPKARVADSTPLITILEGVDASHLKEIYQKSLNGNSIGPVVADSKGRVFGASELTEMPTDWEVGVYFNAARWDIPSPIIATTEKIIARSRGVRDLRLETLAQEATKVGIPIDIAPFDGLRDNKEFYVMWHNIG